MLLLASDKKTAQDGWADDLQPLSSSAASTSTSGASDAPVSCASSDVTLAPNLHNNHASGSGSGSGGSNPRRRSRGVTRREKWSKRIIAVHILHWVLVGIAVLFVVVGLKEWEHDVGVPISRVATFSSYLTLGFQAFFTSYVFLLYWLTREIGVDDAIRHPISLYHLDSRLRGWVGLGSALVTVYQKARAPKTSKVSPVVYAILVYFAAGTVLQLTASGILGVGVYNQTTIIEVSESAVNHVGDYTGVDNVCIASSAGLGQALSAMNGLWMRARNMFLGSVNDTRLPGLEATLLHDIPNTTAFVYDQGLVNGTKMNVRCSQAADAYVEVFLLPAGSNDTSHIIRPDASGAVAMDSSQPEQAESLWVHVRLPAPPYWQDQGETSLNITAIWTPDAYFSADDDGPPHEGGDDDEEEEEDDDDDDDDGDDAGNVYLPTRIFLQDVMFAEDSPMVGHQQIVFVLATGEPSMLLKDSTGDSGVHANYSVTPGRDVSACKTACSGDQDCEDECYPQQMRAFVQVIGCDFWTTQVDVALTPAGLLAGTSPPDATGTPPPHTWGDFFWDWRPTSEVAMDRQFAVIYGTPPPFRPIAGATSSVGTLDMNRHPTLPEILLRDTLKGKQLCEVEWDLAGFAASYFWMYWQACEFPLPFEVLGYEECDVFRSSNASSSSSGSSNSGSGSSSSGSGSASAQSSQSSNGGKYVGAGFESVYTRARLEVSRWRAIAVLVSSVILAGTAIVLLGVKTDSRKGEDLKEATFVETVSLLQDSTLPAVVARTGMQDVTLKYRLLHKEGGRLHHLDVP